MASAPLRLIMKGGSTAVHDVPASRAVRAMLHQAGFRRVAVTAVWEMPPSLPRAIRLARVAGLISQLNDAGIGLTIDDQRPAPANPREHRTRLAEIYTGPWTFAAGHQPYVMPVAATTQVRGLPSRDVQVTPSDPMANPTDGAMAHRAAAIELADGRAVTWDEAAGWRDTATGVALPLSQVAEPAAVVSAIAALPPPPTVDSGRDPAQLDLQFEQALAAYRAHPGFQALQRHDALDAPGPYRLMPGEVHAIRQWQPAAPPPPRWDTAALLTVEPAQRVTAAWATPVGRMPVTSYRAPSAAAQRQLRQARQRQAAAIQRESRQP